MASSPRRLKGADHWGPEAERPTSPRYVSCCCATPAPPDVPAWTEHLVAERRDLLGALLPLEAHELEFLTRLNDGGEIVPELLTADSAMQAKIAASPALKWKALRVRGRT